MAGMVDLSGRFRPGITPILTGKQIVGDPEVSNVIEVARSGNFCLGRFNSEFERKLALFLGVRHVLTVNSGSSADLLALAALTSPDLGARALKAGDEVITVAAGFPTTVNPLLLYGLVPVFVDISLPTYNIDAAKIEAAVSSKTRAIMMAHTLGNPFDLAEVMRIARKYKLWVIEDCCDALGSTYQGQNVGTFGHIGTLSFYPAHHISMGEGGAVFTQDSDLKRILESLRDWGRDCYCLPGKDNTCGKRFNWQLGTLPKGYDHKYTYSQLGFNLKITEMQAAIGVAQLDRLEGFIAARRLNHAFLRERLKTLEKFIVLPQATDGSDPSWFGFLITLKDGGRTDLIKYLDQHNIATRMLFAGNLTRQPYMAGRNYRISGDLAVTDQIMNDTFWIGVHPGLTEEMLEYVATTLEAWFLC